MCMAKTFEGSPERTGQRDCCWKGTETAGAHLIVYLLFYLR